MPLTAATHDLAHLFTPIIVKHLVSFVNDGEADTCQREEFRSTHEVDQATWGCNEDVTTARELGRLFTEGGTTIGDAGAKHGAVAETARFIENLAAQLPSWRDDEDQRFSSDSIAAWVEVQARARRSQFLCFAHKLRDDRNQHGACLAGTCVVVN
jgi:hypothetical protein